MSLARAVGRVAAVMPKAVVPAPQRAISTSAIARGGHAEMFTPEKYNPLGAPLFILMLVVPGGCGAVAFATYTQFSRWTPPEK